MSVLIFSVVGCGFSKFGGFYVKLLSWWLMLSSYYSLCPTISILYFVWTFYLKQAIIFFDKIYYQHNYVILFYSLHLLSKHQFLKSHGKKMSRIWRDGGSIFFYFFQEWMDNWLSSINELRNTFTHWLIVGGHSFLTQVFRYFSMKVTSYPLYFQLIYLFQPLLIIVRILTVDSSSYAKNLYPKKTNQKETMLYDYHVKRIIGLSLNISSVWLQCANIQANLCSKYKSQPC